MSQIYLAPDDEITDVVEKLRLSEDGAVTLIVPKGASLLQSLINVRLLKRKADELNKTLGVVTSDSVSRHIADQCGVIVYHSLGDVPSDLATSRQQPTQKATQGSATAKSQPRRQTETPKESEPKVSHYQELEDAADPLTSTETEEEGTVPESLEQSEPEAIDSGDDLIIGQEEEAPDDEDKSAKHIDIHRHLPNWFFPSLAVLLIVLLIAGGVGAVYFPKATLVLHVPTQSVQKQISITVDPNATSISGNTVPGVARTVSVSATGSAATTGTKQVGNKAIGAVTISDSWSSDNFPLAQGAVLIEVNSGLSFITQQAVVVPGAKGVQYGQTIPGTINVSVIASQPGDQYNLAAAKSFIIQGLTGAEAKDIVGSNASPMTGGTTQTVNIVAQSDIDQAKADANTKLQAAAQSAVSQNEPSDQVLVAQATNVQASYSNPDHAVGDTANTVNVAGNATATALSARIADVENVITSAFKGSVASDKSVILPDISQITWTQSSGSGGDWTLSQTITGQLVAKIDTGSIQSFVLGKKTSSLAENIDSTFNVNSADISKTPSWWPFMPLLKSHINVQIKQ